MAGRDRIGSYKNLGRTGEDLRKKRNEVTVELRKKGRDEHLFKKRNIGPETDASPAEDLSPPIPDDYINLRNFLVSDRHEDLLLGARKIRQMLTGSKNPPVKEVIAHGLVPVLVRLISPAFARVRDEGAFETACSLHYEVAWALTNVASGSSDETKTVVQAGAIPYFVALLKSSDLSVREQAVWALGNIAGDGPAFRDEVLRHGAVEPTLNLVSKDTPLSFLRNIAWTLSNFCRNKNPPPDFQFVKRMLPTLAWLLNTDDAEIQSDVLWALSYVTDGTNDRIQEVVDQGVVPKLVRLLSQDDQSLIPPCLRALGNIVTGTHEQTQTVIDCGALTKMEPFLRHPKASMQKEAAWMVSNIAAGTHYQIQGIINNGLIPSLIAIAKNGDAKPQKEAAWALTNICSGGKVGQVGHITNEGAIEALCGLLKSRDSELQLVLLDGLAKILEAGKKIGQSENACLRIEDCGGLEHLEKLQGSPSDQVYRAAFAIIDEFFSGSDDEENSPPKTVDGSAFQFANPQRPPGKYNF